MPLDRHLDCFQFGIVSDKAAMKDHVQIFVWEYAFISPGLIPRSRMWVG